MMDYHTGDTPGGMRTVILVRGPEMMSSNQRDIGLDPEIESVLMELPMLECGVTPYTQNCGQVIKGT